VADTDSASGLQVFTIGHSNQGWDQFVALLERYGVTAIADVRTAPVSRYAPQFSGETLVGALRERGISYMHLGRELGGRPADRSMYEAGVADYDRMARLPPFAAGLARVAEGAARYRIALMCSEQDPLDCHRCLLVGRYLKERGVDVSHILGDGTLLTQDGVERHLLALAGAGGADDLFLSRADQLALAYRSRGRKVAFAEEGPATVPTRAVA